MPTTRKRKAKQVFEAGRNPPRKLRAPKNAPPTRAPLATIRFASSEDLIGQKGSLLTGIDGVDGVDEDVEIYADDYPEDEQPPPSGRGTPGPNGGISDDELDSIFSDFDLPGETPAGPLGPEIQENSQACNGGVFDESYEVEPYVTCRWRAFLRREEVRTKFDTKMRIRTYFCAELWQWIDEVIEDFAQTIPPLKTAVKTLTGVVYTPRVPERQRLAQSLKPGDGVAFMQVIERAYELKEESVAEVTYVDFNLMLTELETGSNQTRNGGVFGSQSSQSSTRLTATHRQLFNLPETLTFTAVGEGPIVAIRDKWRCQDTHCGNYPYVCWVKREAGQSDRFENHYPASSTIVAAWARDITKGRCTVEEPHDDIRLSLSLPRERSAKEKASQKSSKKGVGSELNVDDFMKVIAASSLSIIQLAQSQILGQQRRGETPAGTSGSSLGPSGRPSGPSSGWQELTYATIVELSYHTRHFFDWWRDQGLARELYEIDEVMQKVVKGGQIDLNMLMDPSDAGMPYSVWESHFGLSVPLLLRLRKMAVRWQSGYNGLTESDEERAADTYNEDQRRKQRDRVRRERGVGGETLI
ncbi:hypothetical protein PSPO01_16648 [Paraphaeosphaeria sporulosa]